MFHKALQVVVITVLSIVSSVCAGPSLGLPVDLVLDDSQSGGFPLVQGQQAAPLMLDEADYPGVKRAAGDLQLDIERVTGIKPALEIGSQPSGQAAVFLGTLGKNSLIDRWVQSGKIDADPIMGKWESFIITTLDNPLPDVPQALVIVGSDKRGTIYGLYELSEQIGVSPWYWWADVPVQPSDELFIRPGVTLQGPPAVKYRGIFINDEEPCLGPWAQEKFGGVNSKMYAHMFELILRLRGNYLWPAMWGKSIYEDDPESARLANEYGIVLGTSHHEPMTRAQKDWSQGRNNYGNGEWNYATNEEGLKKFWREGMERNKDHEVLVTVGMRGDGDEPMVRGGDMGDNIKLLEKIVADQRAIIKDIKGDKASEVPLMWALYKEVKDYYDHGMKVPDDITLLWCDDNWGNIRRLPTPEERKRSGRAGIYYHFDYVGTPRSYKWLNTNPLPKIWEQMNMAYEYGADRIWVVNVGDLKPMEIPIEFFLRMAWDPKAMPKEKIEAFTRNWAQREFGAKYADSIADIVTKYAKYNGWRKPELLEPGTFSQVHYQEAERVLAAWQEITRRAEKINDQLPPEYRDAFFQLVLHPTKASATVAEIYIATGRNQLYAAQGRASANEYAQRVRELFELDKELTNTYHTIADGKWNHMMAEIKMGYTSWRTPRRERMPKVVELNLAHAKSMGVAHEGSELSWPEHVEVNVLVPEKVDDNALVVELETLANQPGFSPFSIIRDPTASGGKAIEWPGDGSQQYLDSPSDDAPGQVSISFTLSQAADVQFELQINASNASNDSFYYKLDSGSWITENNISSNGYERIGVTTFESLAAGTHTLKILRREDGTKLDRLFLRASAGEVSGDYAVAPDTSAGEISGDHAAATDASVGDISGDNAVTAASVSLPTFDSINQQKHWIDIFKRGSQGFTFQATADQPWVRLSTTAGQVDQDQRIWVSIDWDKIPVGDQNAVITISHSGEESVAVNLNAIRSDQYTRQNVDAWGGLTGPTAFAAEKAGKNIPAENVRWEEIPDYGRGPSGMAIFPVTADSVSPPENSPCLEYPVFIAKTGDVQVDLVTGISLKIQPDRGVRIAVSIDNETPQILDAFAGQAYADPSKRGDPSSPPIRDWAKWVTNNARTLKSTLQITEPGVHTLKVWMVDPGMVLEKIVVYQGTLPPSYFGPQAQKLD